MLRLALTGTGYAPAHPRPDLRDSRCTIGRSGRIFRVFGAPWGQPDGDYSEELCVHALNRDYRPTLSEGAKGASDLRHLNRSDEGGQLKVLVEDRSISRCAPVCPFPTVLSQACLTVRLAEDSSRGGRHEHDRRLGY
jgi:hypothetical protein